MLLEIRNIRNNGELAWEEIKKLCSDKDDY